jgi:CheY-like chemotaxis protein
MTSLLVLEDQSRHIRVATDTASSLGISTIKACSNMHAATAYLEKALQGESPLPDGIVVDLDLGYDSGFELLRIWHSSPQLRVIPLIVWTQLGEDCTEICALFKVDAIVQKWEGPAKLREALEVVKSSTRNGDISALQTEGV